MARPEALPHRAEALDRWDVVLLNNVPRAALSTEAMSALGSWVEERGGGLLFAGGQAVFGEGIEWPSAAIGTPTSSASCRSPSIETTSRRSRW